MWLGIYGLKALADSDLRLDQIKIVYEENQSFRWIGSSQDTDRLALISSFKCFPSASGHFVSPRDGRIAQQSSSLEREAGERWSGAD